MWVGGGVHEGGKERERRGGGGGGSCIEVAERLRGGGFALKVEEKGGRGVVMKVART